MDVERKALDKAMALCYNTQARKVRLNIAG